MDPVPIRLMKDRRYGQVPTRQIVVLNSRNRCKEQFRENVRSIKDVGLQKPVVVNERFLPETGNYELVCGEGRLIAYRELQRPEIPAEIIDCDRKTAYLISLVENIARVPPATMWFAREVKRMKDAGMSVDDISRIVGKSPASVVAYISLVERGEERLVRGVEEGLFPLGLAVRIAESDEKGMQDLMMDAFDSGLMTIKNVRAVRAIIKDRLDHTRTGAERSVHPAEKAPPEYTVQELKEDITKVVREGESFAREANSKEGRLVCLLEGLKVLRASDEFMNLVKEEGLSEMPELKFLGRKEENSNVEDKPQWTKELV